MLGVALSINRSLRNVNLNSLFHFLFPFEVCLFSHLFHGKQDNMIGSRGAEALGNALKVNSCLQALHLESSLCVHAAFFTSFERLWWSSGNGIDGQGVIARCQGIESLHELSLNGFSRQVFWEAGEGFTGLFHRPNWR